MAVTYTTNKSLAEVTVGTEVGTWGPFINANQGILDNTLGGTATVALLAANVILSSAQYQCGFIRFTGAITSDLTITFPAIGSFYTIINDTTNSSAFCLTLATTVAGSQAIGIPTGNLTEIMTDSVNVRFRNLPHPGTYWDYSGSSVPRWVNSCTIPPYLNCDGTAFSSAVYPALFAIYDSNILPDSKGRTRMALDQGAGRVSSAVSGVQSNTLHGSGGDQNYQQHNHVININDPTHTHQMNASNQGSGPAIQVGYPTGAAPFSGGNPQCTTITISVVANGTGITATSNNSGPGGSNNMPPVYVGGITMVRAA